MPHFCSRRLGFSSRFYIFSFALVLVAWVAFSSASGLSTANAQDRKTGQQEELPDAIRKHVVTANDLPVFKTRSSANGEVDVQSGVARAMYRVVEIDSARARQSGGNSAEETARAYVGLSKQAYGWSADSRSLKLVNVSESPISAHVLFQQTVDDVPVLYRFVKVSLDDERRPTFVVNGYDAALDDTKPVNSVSTSAIAARAQVARLFDTTVENVSEPTLAILPGSSPRFVWSTIAYSNELGGDWETLIDAQSAAVVSIRDRSFSRLRAERHLHNGDTEGATVDHPQSSFSLSVPRAQSLVSFFADGQTGDVSARASATGSGMVFDPDPMSTAGVQYGAPYVDAGDADQAVLNDQRVLVTLSDISLGTDNLYRLQGPYVNIIGGGSLSYVPPQVATADGFSFVRSDDRFEAVNAYYHVDKSQRYVQSLGFADIRNNGVSVNPLAFSRDDSQYSPWSNIIEFGAGGVDDAEDAGVIWHEYGHALLESSAPGLVDGGPEGQALHEGWADYWAASYLRSLADAGKTSRTDWQNVFRWDSGDGQLWQGRRVCERARPRAGPG